MRIFKSLQGELEGRRGVEGATTDEEDDDDDEDFEELKEDGGPTKVPTLRAGDKAGYLLKRGRQTSTFRRRWFVLHDKILYYFSSSSV